MEPLPFEVRIEIGGWKLFWALLERLECNPAALTAVAQDLTERLRRRLHLETLSEHPTVAALRRLFRAAGCDPTRYRPSSEALLRRLLKGEPMPAINPLVDLNNWLSASLAVPCCVMAEHALMPPYTFRAGLPGESYESLRGPFNLEGKPLLLDAVGPCDSPITGGVRVKVSEETRRVWLVSYLPAGVVEAEEAERQLREFLGAAPVALVCRTAVA